MKKTRLCLSPLEKMMMLQANALNARQIEKYRKSTRSDQQGSIGKKFYTQLVNYMAIPNFFGLEPIAPIARRIRTYSSLRPHLNKLLPHFFAIQKNEPICSNQIFIDFKNDFAKDVFFEEISLNNPKKLRAVIPVKANESKNFTTTKDNFWVIKDPVSGKIFSKIISQDWSVSCNYAKVILYGDGSSEFLHDFNLTEKENLNQNVNQKLCNND